MAWTTAVDDLRTELSDGPTDKLSSFKKVIGLVDGTNLSFKTFEFRRITDFTTAAAPLGIYLNQVLQVAASVSTDDPATGHFTLATAPTEGTALEATYYIQWFLDAEIQTFLKKAAQWLGSSDDYTIIVDGLQPAALKFAAADAYQKLALRWARKLSEDYKMEDAPAKDVATPVDTYGKLAAQYRKDATDSRDQFYKRQGRALQPLFGVLPGQVRDVVPPR